MCEDKEGEEGEGGGEGEGEEEEGGRRGGGGQSKVAARSVCRTNFYLVFFSLPGVANFIPLG